MNEKGSYMQTDLNKDYSFLPSPLVAKDLAKRIKVIRKKKFKTQELFAKHIGLTHAKYARFEKTGNIQLPDFIEVVKGIGRVDELQELFESSAEVIGW